MPLGVDRCEWRTSWYLVGQAADDAAHRPARDEMVEFWRQLRVEDKRAIEWMQRGRASPVADNLLLSPFWERSIGTFHALWRARMAGTTDA